MNEKPIVMSVLKDLADSKHIREVHAKQLPNGTGYYLVARTRTEDRVLYKTRRGVVPRLFKSLDSVADNCRELGISRFEVINIK